jgi:hypothetical protein
MPPATKILAVSKNCTEQTFDYGAASDEREKKDEARIRGRRERDRMRQREYIIRRARLEWVLFPRNLFASGDLNQLASLESVCVLL